MKSRAGLKFDKDIPEWMRRIIRRWYKRLNLGEWQIRVSWEEDEDDADEGSTQATIAFLPQYLDAHLYLSREIDRERFEHCVLHELRHCSLSWIEHAVKRAWDGRRKLGRDEAIDTVRDAIETIIQRDVDIFLK